MTKSRSNATAPNAKGTLVVGSGTDASTTLAVGTNNYVLTADSAEASGVKWAKDPVSDLVTTAGDTLYATAADTLTRLGIGTAGQVLTVNSGATAPEWKTATSGGMTLIASATPTGVGTYTFSSIPSTYKHLLLLVENLSSSAGEISLRVRMNSDTGGNYYFSVIRVQATAVSGNSGSLGQSAIQLGVNAAQNADAWKRFQSSIWFWDYANSQPTKTLSSHSWGFGYGTAADQNLSALSFGGWNNSATINAITIYDQAGPYNFSNGTLKLYGVS